MMTNLAVCANCGKGRLGVTIDNFVCRYCLGTKGVPAIFPCGCSHLKVKIGMCDHYDEQGERRKELFEHINLYNAHLDECEQCKNHPFKLCEVGSGLLHYEALKR